MHTHKKREINSIYCPQNPAYIQHFFLLKSSDRQCFPFVQLSHNLYFMDMYKENNLMYTHGEVGLLSLFHSGHLQRYGHAKSFRPLLLSSD